MTNHRPQIVNTPTRHHSRHATIQAKEGISDSDLNEAGDSPQQAGMPDGRTGGAAVAEAEQAEAHTATATASTMQTTARTAAGPQQ